MIFPLAMIELELRGIQALLVSCFRFNNFVYDLQAYELARDGSEPFFCIICW